MTRVSVPMAADIAGVAPATVRSWIARGRLTRHRDGIDLAQLIAWLDVRRPEGARFNTPPPP